VIPIDNARCRCSVHPTSSELKESWRGAALILSETIRPRRVSRKRVGEDERDDLDDLLLTEFVEYRRVRRPLWDMDVTDSEPKMVRRSDHRDGRSTLTFPRSLGISPGPPVSSRANLPTDLMPRLPLTTYRLYCVLHRSVGVQGSILAPSWLRGADGRLKGRDRHILCTILYRLRYDTGMGKVYTFCLADPPRRRLKGISAVAVPLNGRLFELGHSALARIGVDHPLTPNLKVAWIVQCLRTRNRSGVRFDPTPHPPWRNSDATPCRRYGCTTNFILNVILLSLIRRPLPYWAASF
jgi:hypothetical protein